MRRWRRRWPRRSSLSRTPSLHLADAVKLDLAALAPPPTKVVANLPYGVAATVLLKSVAELPGAALWVAMVQREVGERLAAAARRQVLRRNQRAGPAGCQVRVLRRVPRTVFHPEPNVESALVVMRRDGPAPPPELIALVHAGFAHRRKALAGSLALSPGAPDDLREAAREALDRARAARRCPGRAPRAAGLAAPGRRHRTRANRAPASSMSS